MARVPKGLDRLKRQIRALPNSVHVALHDVLEKNAIEMAAKIRAAAPVDEGDLRDSIDWIEGDAPPAGATGVIRARPSGSAGRLLAHAGLRFTVYAGDDNAYYARWVEFGTAASTAMRVPDSGPKRTDSWRSGFFKGVGDARVGARFSDIKQAKYQGRMAYRIHPGTPAQPYFYPTVRAQARPMKSRVVRAANKAAKAVAALR